MIYKYGLSVIGPYHVEKGWVCQDSHLIQTIEGTNLVVAAIADGLGSCEHSDVGSKIAVEESVKYCIDHYKLTGMTDDDIKILIQNAFIKAQQQINSRAYQDKISSTKYETTLSLVIYHEGQVFYGHSGDGGIVVYREDGIFEKITEEINDQWGGVYCLSFGPQYWHIDKYPHKVAAVMLLTDGLLGLLFPAILRFEDRPMLIDLAHFLMDAERLEIVEKGELAVQKEQMEWIESLSREQVDDDKTLVVLIDTNISITSQPDTYYASPDYEAALANYQRQVQSQLYGRVPEIQTEQTIDLSKEEKVASSESAVNNYSKKSDSANQNNSTQDNASEQLPDLSKFSIDTQQTTIKIREDDTPHAQIMSTKQTEEVTQNAINSDSQSQSDDLSTTQDASLLNAITGGKPTSSPSAQPIQVQAQALSQVQANKRNETLLNKIKNNIKSLTFWKKR